jgi:hypothetical protein
LLCFVLFFLFLFGFFLFVSLYLFLFICEFSQSIKVTLLLKQVLWRVIDDGWKVEEIGHCFGVFDGPKPYFIMLKTGYLSPFSLLFFAFLAFICFVLFFLFWFFLFVFLYLFHFMLFHFICVFPQSMEMALLLKQVLWRVIDDG